MRLPAIVCGSSAARRKFSGGGAASVAASRGSAPTRACSSSAQSYRSGVTNAIGLGDGIGVDTLFVDVTRGDRLLICSDGVHGQVDVNLIDSSFQVEGPLGKDLSFFAAARRSYMDVWFEEVVPADEIGVTSAPVYWDWQSMLVWKPTERDRVRVTGYGSTDGMEVVLKKPVESDPTVRGRAAQDTGFQRGGVAWRHRYAPGRDIRGS